METAQKKKKYSAYQIVFLLIFAAYLIFSFSAMRNFGITWDEPSQHFIGQAYSDLLHGKIEQIDFPYPDLKYYGPFFEMVNYSFSAAMIEAFRMDPIVAFHLLLVITAAAGLYFFFRLISLLFSERAALIASVFWILHPILFSHSQYNPKEIPIISAFIAALYFLCRGFFERKVRLIIAGGSIFGLALAVRMDILFLLPVFFISYIVYILFEFRTGTQKEWSDRIKKDAFYTSLFLGISVIFLYLAWPALWKNPKFLLEAASYFFHHGFPGQVLYFGKLYAGSALPWHYAIFHILATTSALVLAFAFLGLIAAVRNIFSGKKIFFFSLIFLWIFVRLAFGLFPKSVKYDGVRHFMLVIPPILIFAGIGFDIFLRYLDKKLNLANEGRIKLFSTAFGIVFLWLVVEFFWIYPFGGSYYNEAARLMLGPHIEKRFDFEYWGSSYRQGMDWLNQYVDPDSSFCVPVAGHLIGYYPIRADLSFDCTEKANYLMFITRWTHAPENMEEIFKYEQKEPLYKISRYGSDLLLVYKLK